ncbi:MAG: hypothetical protein J6P44_05615 [Bacteroidales bacterium]|nr:hypothetical protein [Bacteroidales bacterium]
MMAVSENTVAVSENTVAVSDDTDAVWRKFSALSHNNLKKMGFFTKKTVFLGQKNSFFENNTAQGGCKPR